MAKLIGGGLVPNLIYRLKMFLYFKQVHTCANNQKKEGRRQYKDQKNFNFELLRMMLAGKVRFVKLAKDRARLRLPNRVPSEHRPEDHQFCGERGHRNNRLFS